MVKVSLKITLYMKSPLLNCSNFNKKRIFPVNNKKMFKIIVFGAIALVSVGVFSANSPHFFENAAAWEHFLNCFKVAIEIMDILLG